MMSKAFWTPNIAASQFNKYSQLGSCTNIRPIKNGLKAKGITTPCITWTRPIVMIFTTLSTTSGHSGFRFLVIIFMEYGGSTILKVPSPFFFSFSILSHTASASFGPEWTNTQTAE